jgi:recombinational DNA repair ATPase RecF
MKILRFEARKLHGYLNFSLNLNSKLIFLTGINGAGKTTAVRSITALCQGRSKREPVWRSKSSPVEGYGSAGRMASGA